MYLWDSNILRHFGEGHSTLALHLARVAWTDIALPSVVVAEVLRGRAEFALKAHPSSAPAAHAMLIKTQRLLDQFTVVVFDHDAANILEDLLKTSRSTKRYADMMIAAMALAGQHIVVTRNRKHFADLLPPPQLMNWIDDAPR